VTKEDWQDTGVAALCVLLFCLGLWACIASERGCARREEQMVTTYPYMGLLQFNPALALMPVQDQQNVCVEWKD
jgi:hypothetical protein